MELSIIIPHIEALVFASEKPLTTLELVELVNNALGFIEDRATLDQLESALEAIREKYQSEFYPFEVRESGGGWQYLTKKEYHKTVAQLNGEKFLKRLSSAALETLSIIAYKQPVTKGEMENIRGVNCDYAVQKLLEKELIIITGRKENAPGQPLLYATSKTFMDYFGINSAEDLPKLSDIMNYEQVEPTVVQLGFDLKDEVLPGSSPTDVVPSSSLEQDESAPEEFPLSDSNTLVVDEDGNVLPGSSPTDVVSSSSLKQEDAAPAEFPLSDGNTLVVDEDGNLEEAIAAAETENTDEANVSAGGVADETVENEENTAANEVPKEENSTEEITGAAGDSAASEDTDSAATDNDDKEKKPD